MAIVRSAGTLIFCVTLAGCASERQAQNDYTESDAGRVLIAMGAVRGTDYDIYKLDYRAVTQPGLTGAFHYCQHNMFCAESDYENSTETGVVKSYRLKPGEYEIHGLELIYSPKRHFESKQPFSIKFTIKPNQLTYVGHYQAVGLKEKNIVGISEPTGAVFMVSDRMSADVDLLSKKISMSDSLLISDQTPIADDLNSPFFKSSVPSVDAGKSVESR